jgi:SDR family mycofactocin-dependent oxidoreductase
MSKLEGRVAFITGAARGQGRAHAARLARDGADVVISDICGPIDGLKYAATTDEDLAETVALVEKEGRRALARAVDVRDLDGLTSLADDAIAEFGRIDIVVANAGILSVARMWEITPEQWKNMIDVNLTGVWHTIRATVPHMIEAGNGGSIILTSSVGGLKGLPFMGHYNASKHGVVGLCKTLANELGEFNIRVNTIQPAGVDTLMIYDPDFNELLKQHSRTLAPIYMTTLPGGCMQPEDMAAVVSFLASDEARFMTGSQIPYDFGTLAR